ncbi:MAG: hypothetical protein ACKO37_03125 [Vampirovibrionales bacterium]
MTNWGMLEAKFINRNPQNQKGYWIFCDEQDEKGQRYIRATQSDSN